MTFVIITQQQILSYTGATKNSIRVAQVCLSYAQRQQSSNTVSRNARLTFHLQWMLQIPGATSYIGCIGKDKFGEVMKKHSKLAGVNVSSFLFLFLFPHYKFIIVVILAIFLVSSHFLFSFWLSSSRVHILEILYFTCDVVSPRFTIVRMSLHQQEPVLSAQWVGKGQYYIFFFSLL